MSSIHRPCLSRRSRCAAALVMFFLSLTACCGADSHLVVEKSRILNGNESKSSSEIWCASDKCYVRTGEERAEIYRRDRGLLWRIDYRAGTYEETADKETERSAGAPPDLHRKYFKALPSSFDWRIREGGKGGRIAGFPCRSWRAEGDSDFDQITLDFQISSDNPFPHSSYCRDHFVHLLRGHAPMEPLYQMLQKSAAAVPLAWRSSSDYALAPPVEENFMVTGAEDAPPPAEIYELPVALHKAGAAMMKSMPFSWPAFPLPGNLPHPVSGGDSASTVMKGLPAAVTVELRRLECAWSILDMTAEKIWPGWSIYRHVPILLHFENGLQVLVGHPAPPDGFSLLPGCRVGESAVYTDSRGMTSLPLSEPLHAEGSIAGFGTWQGAPVETIVISFFSKAGSPQSPALPFSAEDRILLYIHELFRCYPDAFITEKGIGRFCYNPDSHFALYAELEAMALRRACEEKDDEKALAFIRDFLAARRIKREKMDQEAAACERSDELAEGGALYAEMEALRLLKNSSLPESDLLARDPFFHQFAHAAELEKRNLDLLTRHSRTVAPARQKCRYTGSFQALMLQRFFPGWQTDFSGEACSLEGELAKKAGFSAGDEALSRKRLEAFYPCEEIKTRQQRAIKERDDAFTAMESQKGTTFIISFKKMHACPADLLPEQRKSCEMGFVRIFPEGLGTIRADGVEINGGDAPASISWIHYVRIVVPDANGQPAPCRVNWQRKEGAACIGLSVRTPLFTVKADRAEIREGDRRVKIILSPPSPDHVRI